MQKVSTFHIKGMQKDLSKFSFNSEYAFNIHNMRLATNEENSLVALTNEKGNLPIQYTEDSDELVGIVIGQAVINDTLILFTSNSNFTIEGTEKSRIYKLNFIDDLTAKLTLLYEGDLNFNISHPIETLVSYENEEVQKVYWTDGINPPRLINIAEENLLTKNSNYFDFTSTLKGKETVNIERIDNSNGIFSPGTIQYVFTYFNKFGKESSVFYVSPLFYTSNIDRGTSTDKSVNCSFKITINNYDNSYNYIRVYSISRASIDSMPDVRKVIDYKIPTFTSDPQINENTNTIENNLEEDTHNIPDDPITPYNREIILYDNNSNTEIADPYSLLYTGANEFTFSTFTTKDNVLFCGNIKTKNYDVNEDIKTFFKDKDIDFKLRDSTIHMYSPTGYYNYKNQLNSNSHNIKTFKYLETYRFGVQFQHYTGKWSDPIFIKDATNNKHIEGKYAEETTIKIPYAESTIYLNESNYNSLINDGYIAARPVIVYPEIQDRNCICQGILCPTVFNVKDRVDNKPFAQASWFARPNAPFDIDRTYTMHGSELYDRDSFGNKIVKSEDNSRFGVLNDNLLKYKIYNNGTAIATNPNVYNKGSWSEFRHLRALGGNEKVLPIYNIEDYIDIFPTGALSLNLEGIYNLNSGTSRNSEIQCMQYELDESADTTDINSQAYITLNNDNNIDYTWINNHKENYYVDQSIVTLHSPDIEFNSELDNFDFSNLKLRIVGIVPITSSMSDIDIQTSNLGNSAQSRMIRQFIGDPNISRHAFKGLNTGMLWKYQFEKLTGQTSMGMYIYPFHKTGNIIKTEEDGICKLSTKKISNLKYSYNSFYLNNLWEPSSGISDAKLFNSNEMSLLKVKAPLNSNLEDITYYGNIDTIVAPIPKNTDDEGYNIYSTLPIKIESNDTIYFKETPFSCFNILSSDINLGSSMVHTSLEGVQLKYKSTPHIVIPLNYTEDHKSLILPTLKDGNIYDIGTNNRVDWDINNREGSITDLSLNNSTRKIFWEKNKTLSGIKQDTIDINFYGYNNSEWLYGPGYGWLWLGELYRDNVVNRFGGDNTQALQNNNWISCGESINLTELNEEQVGNTTIKELKLQWLEGDTYYQRYDNLKTYPFTQEDENGVVDIVSFMCETRVNIDGRYDNNRGKISNLYMTPVNFNLINKAYSQKNNFYTYHILDPEYVNVDNFKNQIIFSNVKTYGEKVDTWTKILSSNVIDLDGDLGEITALKRYNNTIIAFQERGISQILFNERTQIATAEGIPIELGTSGKVEGKRYFTNKIGCSNKYSITETPVGLYFIDDNSGSIYLFNGQLDNVSDKFGFHTWCAANYRNKELWNPVDFNNVVTFYDSVNKDVMFISKDICLSYSELLGQFSSFYDYGSVSNYIEVENKRIMVNNNSYKSNLWLHNKGEYCKFFNEYKPFSIEVIVNQDPVVDKIFNTLEFRANSFDDNNIELSYPYLPFDKLDAYNEYQSGTQNLNLIGKIENNKSFRTSNFKRKFRIWRANIPRDDTNKRDRMRNTWLNLKLSKNSNVNNKTVLQDLMVHYFD